MLLEEGVCYDQCIFLAKLYFPALWPLLIFQMKLKKMEKITRPSRYDLNQIPYDYRVELTNRFKELDLIDRVPDELWMEIWDIVQ